MNACGEYQAGERDEDGWSVLLDAQLRPDVILFV
jgi:hypothetical protein